MLFFRFIPPEQRAKQISPCRARNRALFNSKQQETETVDKINLNK